MRLFTIGKIPLFCDGIGHRLEKRKGGDEVKVVDLTLRIQPFTAQLAAALDPDGYGFIKRMLFKATSGDPISDLRSVEFRVPGDSQKLIVFASNDTTEPSIAFDQVKVTKVRARTEKGVDGWALIVGVTFGPVGRAELEYVNEWYTGQRCVTWDEGEPFLDFEPGDDEDPEADKPVQRVAPMWDDDAPAARDADTPATRDAKRSVETARKPMSRHKDRTVAAKAKQKSRRARA